MATIVTAFYPLEKSKHGVRKYLEWIRNFCQIQKPIVIFTDSRMAPLLERLRRESADKTRIITKEFDTYDMTAPDRMAFWRQQTALDPEAAIHSPELYAVWALKQECVALAIAENPFGHDWFVWCDIGIQRVTDLQPLYESFPDKVTSLCAPGRIHFLEVSRIPDVYVARRGQSPMLYPPPATTLGGGCIAGDRVAWATFSASYIAMLDRFRERGWFAGKDQIVFFAMLAERSMPFRLFHAVPIGTPPFVPHIHWMSFPVILGGQAPALVDARFEEAPDSTAL
jgi:hypothetical protein